MSFTTYVLFFDDQPIHSHPDYESAHRHFRECVASLQLTLLRHHTFYAIQLVWFTRNEVDIRKRHVNQLSPQFTPLHTFALKKVCFKSFLT